MASILFTAAIAKMLGLAPAINFLADTLKWYLVDVTYVPNPDHDWFSNVTEIGAVTGYTPGVDSGSHPVAASKVITVDDTLNKVWLDAADPSFGSPGVGATVTGFALYKFITAAGDSPVIAFIETPDTPTNGAALTGVLDAVDGIGKLAQP